MYSKEVRESVVQMRRNGMSYHDIVGRTGIPKGTLSKWLNTMPLTNDQLAYYTKKHREACVEWGKLTSAVWKKNKEVIYTEYAPPLDDPVFMLGIGLYWGEGDKKSGFGLSNSDPRIIGEFMKWAIYSFPNDFSEFSITIHIHHKAQERGLKEYWEEALPKVTKRIVYSRPVISISKASQRKKGNILPYGTAHVRCRGRGMWKVHVKLRKAIDSICKGLTQ